MSTTPPVAQRLDVWLDVACLFKTRSQAQTACRAGKVELNGARAKPHRPVEPGDELAITRPGRRPQLVVVLGLAEHSLPKAEARALYEDRTPEPTPEERELARILRQSAAAAGAGRDRAPRSKKERRQIRRLKEEMP